MRTNVRAAAMFLGLAAITLVVVFATVGCQSGEQPETEQIGTQAGSDQVITYTCPMHPEVVSNEPGKCPECGMNLVAAGTEDAAMDASETDMVMYTCPMHPEVQKHEPGECPVCGMDLIEAGSEGGE